MSLHTPRVIPVLLVDGEDLVKTIRFSTPIYLGDPINAVRIFNEKQVDEVCILDIGASKSDKGPNLRLAEAIANEAFMPIAIGGGIRHAADASELFAVGIEKILTDSMVHRCPSEFESIIATHGAQAVSVVMTTTPSEGQTMVTTPDGNIDLATATDRIQDLSPGELVLYSSDRDGTRSGYDLESLAQVANKLSMPVIALGGAGVPEDFRRAVECGASAVAAGAYFTLQGKFNAPLISYPVREEISSWFA